MNLNLKHLIGCFLFLSTTMISCSKVKFSNTPSSECTQDCVQNPDGTETYRRVLTVQPPNNKVDILFVVDNSGTMVQEQIEIANRFPGFINSISHLDWRIAIATTDNYPVGFSSVEVNGGEYRNGKLVPFRSASGSTGQYFIQKTTSNAQSLFQSTIQRPETLACLSTPAKCPSIVSGDERGILSAIKQVLNPSPVSFTRADAQLHVIFIADEDERSNGGGLPGFALEENDRPQKLVSTLEATGKRFQVHSIINIPASMSSFVDYMNGGFEDCVASQINDLGGQEYQGCHYAMATALTGGTLGSIRSSNYTSILNEVSYNIQDTSLAQLDFNCVPYEVVITPVEGQPYPSTLSDPYVVYSPGTRYITFSPALPSGTQLNVEWTCPRGSL